MPHYFLVNKAEGNLLTVDTSANPYKLSSEPLDLQMDSKEQAFDIPAAPGVGNSTDYIKIPLRNKHLSHFDGAHVDFNGTASGGKYVDGTDIMWRFETLNTISGFHVYKIFSVNDSGSTCLTAEGNKIVARKYKEGENQHWIRKDASVSDIGDVYQAIIRDRQQVIEDLNDQIQTLNDDVDQADRGAADSNARSIVHGKDAGGWYRVAREIFQNGNTMYRWGPVSQEQEALGQRYWFRGFEANYG